MDVSERIGPVRGVDLIISVHWPAILDKEHLGLAKVGCINLHNSYLPWNRGANACTWAIIDRTPLGATLHWMDKGIDTGPIILQERLPEVENETADELYRRTADAEVRVFEMGMIMLLGGDHRRVPQLGAGTMHYKKDFERLVRAMTTNDCRVIREKG